jgi:hypothetical protein
MVVSDRDVHRVVGMVLDPEGTHGRLLSFPASS